MHTNLVIVVRGPGVLAIYKNEEKRELFDEAEIRNLKWPRRIWIIFKVPFWGYFCFERNSTSVWVQNPPGLWKKQKELELNNRTIKWGFWDLEQKKSKIFEGKMSCIHVGLRHVVGTTWVKSFSLNPWISFLYHWFLWNPINSQTPEEKSLILVSSPLINCRHSGMSISSLD